MLKGNDKKYEYPLSSFQGMIILVNPMLNPLSIFNSMKAAEFCIYV